MNNKYCVYLHRNKQTSEVYYIGSGVQNKREYNFTSRSKSWYQVHNNFGTNVEVVRSGLTQSEARQLEQELIDSGEYLGVVNKRKVNIMLDISSDVINEYLVYDETSASCLRWKKKSGSRSVVGADAGWLTFRFEDVPKKLLYNITR